MLDSKIVHNEFINFITSIWNHSNLNFDSIDANKIDWGNFARLAFNDSSTLAKPPYILTECGIQELDENWGIGNQAYRLNIDLYYIHTFSHQKEVESSLCAMRKSLLTTIFKSYQVLNISHLDLSRNQEANSFFLKHNLPFFAGKLSVNLLFGNSIIY